MPRVMAGCIAALGESMIVPRPEQTVLREENARLTAENMELCEAIVRARRALDTKDARIASFEATIA